MQKSNNNKVLSSKLRSPRWISWHCWTISKSNFQWNQTEQEVFLVFLEFFLSSSSTSFSWNICNLIHFSHRSLYWWPDHLTKVSISICAILTLFWIELSVILYFLAYPLIHSLASVFSSLQKTLFIIVDTSSSRHQWASVLS